MAQLEDCYFCGRVEDSLESYPVIPPEADPPEEAQRTVVVCPTCRTKLDRVLDPVVGYFDPAVADDPGEGGDVEGSASGAKASDVDEDVPEERAEGDTREEPVELPEGTEDIVRLLRNREFPVERSEIVAVAANAYGMGREECDTAVDALIARGWLTERDGQLHRAD